MLSRMIERRHAPVLILLLLLSLVALAGVAPPASGEEEVGRLVVFESFMQPT